jgi:Flp pilus assembly pilin Flp
MGVGFAAAIRQCDRGQDASEYGMLMAMIVLVVLSGAIFFGQSVRTSMEQASECIEYASSADATAGTSDGGAAMQVEEEKKSGSLADRLAALLDTSDDGEGPRRRQGETHRHTAESGEVSRLGRL